MLFGLTPFAAVFYPVSILPVGMREVAWLIPASHVFEGMRAALLEGRIAWGELATAAVLNLVWLAAMAWVFMGQLRQARERGSLLGMGE